MVPLSNPLGRQSTSHSPVQFLGSTSLPSMSQETIPSEAARSKSPRLVSALGVRSITSTFTFTLHVKQPHSPHQ